jgi:Ca2+ transporting ATPase
MIKDQDEALLKQFKNSEMRKSIEMRVDEVNIAFFSEIFMLDKIEEGRSQHLINKIGGQEGLLRNLDVQLSKGLIIDDKNKLQSRIDKFGRNTAVIREPKTILELVIDCLEDKMLRILLVAAFVSLVIGVAQEGWAHGWIEGFSIFLAVLIVVTISSCVNHSKDLQFAKLNKENEKKSLTVRRNSNKIVIDSEEVLVGDIIYLEIGNVICVDCILLSGEVEVDESSLTGESEKVDKSKSNPFLISGSKITNGECEAVVCAVGPNSSLGRSKLQMENNDQTPLQEKLEVIADIISFYGQLISLLIFLVMIGKEVLYRLFFSHQTIFDSSLLDTLVNAFIIAVTVTVVAIPEGLPMAVTISLGFSVFKMKEEENLVRHIDASETMGNVNNICTDKTGTLTKGEMFVRSLYFQGKDRTQTSSSNSKLNSKLNSNLNLKVDPSKFYLFLEIESENLILHIKSIVNNITAFVDTGSIETNSGAYLNIRGNSTESALLRYILALPLLPSDIKYINDHSLSYAQYLEKGKLLYRLPFNSDNKFMMSVYTQTEKNRLTVYFKGAPEILINYANSYIANQGQISPLSKEVYNQFMTKQLEYADRSERTLLLAYIEVNDNLLLDCKNANESAKKILTEKNLILVSLVGIADPPRDSVKEAIESCHKAGVTVRMITGDNINTALAISKEVGILSSTEYNIAKNSDFKSIDNNAKVYAMEGKHFREVSGGYYEDKEKKTFLLKDPEKFRKTVENLKVIARTSPDDKFLLVLGLKELKSIVAVTGDGTNDAQALRKSDVGFSMGIKGTEVARDASDIVLLKDNFASIVTAIKYGRNVYDCIRKFIQFQLTTNIVAVFMTLLGGLILKDAPLNAIQMLWVNLIMDSFASLALATEKPSEKLLERQPYPREESIITQSMLRNILIQAAYQILLLTWVIFFGDTIFGVPDDRSLSHFEWNESNGYHFTLFFNIFVFLQIFNSVNARKLEQNELNPFEGISGNLIYISVQSLTFVGQIGIVQYGGRSLRTKPLSLKQHLACLAIAATSLVVGYLGKTSNFLQTQVDQNKVIENLRSNSLSLKLKNQLPERGQSFRAGSGINMQTKTKNPHKN